MNLVWHIAKKDLRRLAGPVALWCVLVVGRVVLPWWMLGSVVTDGDGFRIWESMLMLLLGLDLVVEAILVAALVHEDVPTGTVSWWPTRPIAGGRLLLAKLLSGGLLFLAVPLVLLSVAWLTAGFSMQEWLAAVAWFALTRGIIALVALGLAAVAENLVQFLFGAIALGFGFVLIAAHAEFGGFLARPAPAIRHSGREWMLIVAFGCAVSLFAHQYLTRRRDRTLMILGASLALIMGIRLGWQGVSVPLSQLIGDIDPPIQETSENQAVKLDEVVATTRGDRAVALSFSVEGMPAGSYAWPKSIRGGLGEGTESITFIQRGPPRSPERMAVSFVAGLKPEASDEAWTATGTVPIDLGQLPTELRGRVGIRWMRGRLMGELPLQPDAKLVVGSNLTRMLDLRQEEENFVVTLAERDALPPRKYWPDMGRLHGLEETRDFYVLVNRAKGLVHYLATAEVRGVVAGTMVTFQRRLILAPPTVSNWEQGAVLLKVRFELDHYFMRPFAVKRIGTGS